MKIFVTGGTGFIGKTVVNNLIKENHLITILLLPNEYENNISGVTQVRGDVTLSQSLVGLLDGHDVLIHMAGAVGFQNLNNCIRINQEGTRNVVNESLRAGIKRFIHMSSVSVYGRIPDVVIHEDFPYKKIGDPYGDTKIEAEKAVRELMRKNVNVTILRPTAIYGPGDNKFLPKLLENLYSGKFKIMGNGRHSVDLVHVYDVADAVSVVLQNEKSFGNIYNVANHYNPSWNEFIKMVAIELGVPAPDKFIPYRVALAVAGIMELISKVTGKPPRLNRYSIRLIGRQYHYNNDKLKEELDFSPSRDLLIEMRKCIADYLAR